MVVLSLRLILHRKQFSSPHVLLARPQTIDITDVNVLIFLDFSFRYDSVHQKYKRLKRYVAHYAILWHRVKLRNECSALQYLIQC